MENGHLVVCIPSPIVSMDPTNYRDRTTQAVIKNIFDSLTTRDHQMRILPQLAESWEILDSNSWEFKLRKDVVFHNGDKFTAEDVQFTLVRVIQEGAMDGKTSPRKALLDPITGVEIVDNYTVRIKTERPWPILPLMLSLQEIIPKKYMEAKGSQGFQTHPIGTGPFKYISAEGKKRLILKRFEHYYDKPPANRSIGDLPVQQLVFETVPLKAERIAMLKRGLCDIILNVPPPSVPILETSDNIRVLSSLPTRSYFGEINCNKPLFQNVDIRRALNYAVDKNALVHHILKGKGTILSTVMLPHAFGFHAGLKPYPYDPEKAQQILRENNFQPSRTIKVVSTDDNRDFASLITGFLTKMGLKSTLEIIRTNRPALTGAEARWDIFVSSWGNSTLDPVGILVPKFKTGGRGNFSNYHNEKVDQLLFMAERTLETQPRMKYYQKVQEIIYNEAPMIFGYAAEEFYGVRSSVTNFHPAPSGMMNLHGVYMKNGDQK
jgi:peptide/nickel transport system substrate-binding protein